MSRKLRQFVKSKEKFGFLRPTLKLPKNQLQGRNYWSHRLIKFHAENKPNRGALSRADSNQATTKTTTDNDDTINHLSWSSAKCFSSAVTSFRCLKPSFSSAFLLLKAPKTRRLICIEFCAYKSGARQWMFLMSNTHLSSLTTTGNHLESRAIWSHTQFRWFLNQFESMSIRQKSFVPAEMFAGKEVWVVLEL